MNFFLNVFSIFYKLSKAHNKKPHFKYLQKISSYLVPHAQKFESTAIKLKGTYYILRKKSIGFAKNG